MLEKYKKAICALTPSAQAAVVGALGLPDYPGALFEMLEACGYHQSDVVLVLLREGTQECFRGAEALLGKPITRCPPGLRSRPVTLGFQAGVDWLMSIIDQAGLPDARRFVKVTPNYQLPTTDSWGRYRLLRVGMTVGQFLARGGRRRDVLEWQREGKVVLSS
jgi:hypothetical protein